MKNVIKKSMIVTVALLFLAALTYIMAVGINEASQQMKGENYGKAIMAR